MERKQVAQKLKYQIDLQDVFDRAYSNKGKEIRSALRPMLSDNNFKIEFGKEAIREIVKRTQDQGIDKKGTRFVKYAEAYKKSIQFKIAGKTSKVNLTLTGEMLASMVPKALTKKINVEFADGQQNDKAHGHVTGGGHLPVRDFFGLPEKVEEEVMRKVLNKMAREETLSKVEITAEIGRQKIAF